MGLEDQPVSRHTGDALQREVRVFHVVKHPQPENEVELTDQRWREFEHLHLAILYLGVKKLPGEQEPVLRAPPLSAPAE